MKLAEMSEATALLISKNESIFACPACGGSLDVSISSNEITCALCQRSFKWAEGIPLLFWPNEWDSKTDVTEIVKTFYEKTPFPNYEGLDSKWRLWEKADKGIFAHLLDAQIPLGARILEVGCGPGQMSNFLGIKSGRTVFGTDMCLNSLKLGQQFKEQNAIDNVAFFQMNLFKPIFKPESFHVAVCNGVLHHTSDPFQGFKSVLSLVKKGGFIVIGLYNTFGRFSTDLRRFVFNLSGNRLKFLDPRFRNKNLEHAKRQTWFMDQYKHPHESKHSFGDVLGWFKAAGVEFVNSIPKVKAFESFTSTEKLFKPAPQGTTIDHFLVQAKMFLKDDNEGGFFVMIGQKKI